MTVFFTLRLAKPGTPPWRKGPELAATDDNTVNARKK
jgi:hypothetical protein